MYYKFINLYTVDIARGNSCWKNCKNVSDLGKALKTGLSVVKSEKPSKPIKFLANYLNNYENFEEDDEPAVINNHPIDVQCTEINKKENDNNFHNESREETEVGFFIQL